LGEFVRFRLLPFLNALLAPNNSNSIITFFYFVPMACPWRARLRALRAFGILIMLIIADTYYSLWCARLRVYLCVHFETIQKRANALYGPAKIRCHIAQRM